MQIRSSASSASFGIRTDTRLPFFPIISINNSEDASNCSVCHRPFSISLHKFLLLFYYIAHLFFLLLLFNFFFSFCSFRCFLTFCAFSSRFCFCSSALRASNLAFSLIRLGSVVHKARTLLYSMINPSDVYVISLKTSVNKNNLNVIVTLKNHKHLKLYIQEEKHTADA